MKALRLGPRGKPIMSKRQCIVCQQWVREGDEKEHLRASHLGPHYFWFDCRQFRTMEPSMTMGDIRKLVDAPTFYPVFEDRDGEEIPWGDGVAVDLTREPHFFAIPPATW